MMKMKRIPNHIPETIDLRGDFDAAAMVDDGVLYRKGAITQVWWLRGSDGTVFNPPVCETWTAPDVANARENFESMKERWTQ